MLFKLSFSNIRKSLKDYAVYFFTLIISVAIFYLFSSVEDQEAFRKYISTDPLSGNAIRAFLKGLSIFVAALLGLLIVYANRFLMKRRHKEFMIYLMLGMSKRRVSFILFLETLIIGIGSLFAGLVIGIGLSQFMSALVANLFEADLNAFKFVISFSIISRTILYFSISYIVVMLLNSIIISRCKLIDLIQYGKKSEMIKQKNPWLCVGIFAVAVCGLAYAYTHAVDEALTITRDRLLSYCAIGSICTLLIFWSVSGLLLRAVMSMKKLYYKGLNCFTFRQISSKVNTTVISMTIICLILFATICTLSTSFSYRDALNKNLKECCPADIEITLLNSKNVSAEKLKDKVLIKETPEEALQLSGADKLFSEIQSINIYIDKKTETSLTIGDLLGKYSSGYKKQLESDNGFIVTQDSPQIISLSDYNNLMKLFGRENDTVSMSNDEYFVLANDRIICSYLDDAAADGTVITYKGNTLKPALERHIQGTVDMFANTVNAGVLVVHDSLLSDLKPRMFSLIANYSTSDKDKKRANDKELKHMLNEWVNNNYTDPYITYNINSKVEISDDMIGESAIVTFIGLYLGLVFLIVCAAVIALKQLSDCTDSHDRYEVLRNIGAEEKNISRSLFAQTGVFFMLPLCVAVIHSVFGLKFCKVYIDTFSKFNIFHSICITAAIIVLIYGGYFLITYISGHSMIRSKK